MDEQTFTLQNWWSQGGIVMYPLAIYSILGMAILFEKLTFLKKLGGDMTGIVNGAIDEMKSGKIEPPSGEGPVFDIIRRIHNLGTDGLDSDALLRAVERESSRLEDLAMRGMIWLAIIGNTSPFVGLFGTVIGIIRAFTGLSKEGLLTDPSGNPELIRGIAEALVATATGLLVAVPAVICYNFLLREIRSRTMRIELSLADYADALSNNKGDGK
ncbi:MAG: MotA/TolQ/ExbB proton channel family protein [bacterium]